MKFLKYIYYRLLGLTLPQSSVIKSKKSLAQAHHPLNSPNPKSHLNQEGRKLEPRAPGTASACEGTRGGLRGGGGRGCAPLRGDAGSGGGRVTDDTDGRRHSRRAHDPHSVSNNDLGNPDCLMMPNSVPVRSSA